MMKNLLLGVVLIALSSSVARAQDATAGEAVFRQCLPCHAVGEDARNKVGPELNGLDGRKAGTAEGYSYSEPNKSSGITWDEASFKEYIKNPRARIPGTKMVFAGLKNDKQIDDLWAYLKQFNADGSKK